MSTISFLNIDMHGHVNPTLPVVAELVRRGHTVTYHVGPGFAEEAAAAGAKAYPYPPAPPEPGSAPLTPVRFLAGLAKESVRLLPGVLDDLVRIAPDLVVHETSCLWGQVAARRLGIPAAASFTTFAYNRQCQSPTRPTPRLLAAAMGDLPAAQRYVRSRIRLRTRYGLKGLPWVDLADVRQPLNLLYTSPHVQPGGRLMDASFRFVGPCIGARPVDPTFDACERPEPLIYLSLGTVFSTRTDLMRTLIGALAPLAGRLLVSTGQIPPEALGPLPNNVEARSSVPQPDVLQTATLFVTHGGANSANEALYFGVPMLVLPQDADQPLVAARVAEIGAGLALAPEEVDRDSVRTAAACLLRDPAFAEAARRISGAQRRCGGAAHAVDELESYLDRSTAR